MKPVIKAHMEDTEAGSYIVFKFPYKDGDPVQARYKISSLAQARAIAADMQAANSEYFSGVSID
jgi:hypothetical protein